MRFGRWTAEATSSTSMRTKVACRCDCGNTAVVPMARLAYGKSQSCGCLRNEQSRALLAKHLLSRHPSYRSWVDMISRCSDPRDKDFKDYGARGIRVCERWADCAAFVEDMGARPPAMTLDRVDHNGNYEPDNCRWATQIQQARNRRSTVLLTFNGKTQCAKDWATETGLRYQTLLSRLKAGWPVARALSVTARTGA